jgi:hypothetical protein
MRLAKSVVLAFVAALGLTASSLVLKPAAAAGEAAKMPVVPKRWNGVLWSTSFKGSESGGNPHRQLSAKGGTIPLSETSWKCTYSAPEVLAQDIPLSPTEPTTTFETVKLECAYQDAKVQTFTRCVRTKGATDTTGLILEDKKGQAWVDIRCAFNEMPRPKKQAPTKGAPPSSP